MLVASGRESGVSCQHGPQRLQGRSKVALVGLAKLGQQLGQGGPLLAQQLAQQAGPLPQ
jgi:hypothetical protein